MATERLLNLSYYPWITQNVAEEIIRRAINDFATVLQEKATTQAVKYKVEVQKPLDVPTQIEWIAQGKSHIALMNPLGYVMAVAKNPKVVANVLATRIIDGKDGSVYYAQLYTSKKTAIANGDAPKKETEEQRTKRLLPRTRGKRLGFGSPQSTSNFLFPAVMLQKAGVHPFASFASVQFIGGHETVARAVYDGTIDVGAGHDGAIVDLSNQPGYGDANDRLVRLGRVTLPSDPIALNLDDAAERALIVKALLATGKDDRGKAAIGAFWGKATGLASTKPEVYNALRDAMNSLSLRDEDLLRPNK